ncbi:uncharacterized protein, partial [Temnothorax longispinosus]|uniref:uncharacterized protein n=1 Tax=Temnothorax longispinosus TaxID=300112 RepID=UPI003A9A65B9
INMLGECLWPCLTCRTASNIRNARPVCNKCYILLVETRDIKALTCGHIYCKNCQDQLPLQIDGPLPMFCCVQCNKWSTIFFVY